MTLRKRLKPVVNAPFPVPSPLTHARLKIIVELARLTFERGWNPGTGGNFSVRQDDVCVWQSPSGLMKGKLQASQFIPVNITSEQPINPQSAKASDETPLHLAIYRADPTARAVMHVHSPAVIRASRQKKLEISGQEMQKALGLKTHEAKIDIPVIANTQDMSGLAQKVASSLDLTSKVLVLKDHGVYAWGREPEEAFHRIEALEFLCQTLIPTS